MTNGEGFGSGIFFDGGTFDFGNGIHMIQLLANTCIIETDEGVVLFDVGLEFVGQRIVEQIRAVTDKPVRYMIYGHGHADHAFGTKDILDDSAERGHPRPVIIAHENVPGRLDRYQETLPYQDYINRIQFGVPEGLPAFVRTYIYPDETFSDEMSFRLGGLTFELRHAKGETDDATWLWIPELEAACVSDLWVWSCPNVGNPFKVQRYAIEWAQALEEIAGKSPELMLPGHGNAIEGKDKTVDACLTVARALKYLRRQVIEMLNQGRWQEDILNSFEWPDEFAGSPYLQPIYGHPYFIVQAILRRYHGWYDGNPSHLFPSKSSEIAGEVLRLAGGSDKALERVRELQSNGQLQLALHVVDFIIDGSSEPSAEALEAKARLLRSLADRERSLIARNILLGGVRRIEEALGRGEP